MTQREQKLKALLKESLMVIDSWDLVHGSQSEESFQQLLNLMLSACAETGVDPNSLFSLQNEDWEVVIKRKK
jgi:hypothetical protein